ncbi:MAG: hypothetical protein HC851_19090 [Acaryochloris sp. RU_4_1]|nr:hypothetical protein [Acaryochloris sp. RU_4_1]NJR56374.1 hypothetical protein [Acaryochloris sp. CRU_2_0]
MNTKGTSLAALTLLSGLSVLAFTACSSTTTWKEYSSTEGKYSVSMPGSPKEQTQPLPLPNGSSLDMKLAQLDLGKEAFVVAFVDFPGNQKPTAPVQTLLAASIKGAVTQSINGTISNEKETQVNGVPCRQFQATGKYKSIDASMSGTYCFTGNRLYQVFAIGENTGKTFTEKADKYLASFKITK